MTTINKSGKLLVVDSSTAMLHVLKNFTGKHGYDADHYADPADACERLDQRFQDFSCDYRSVILGWPEGRLNLVNELLQKLSSADHDGLPLIIITQELNADVQALVKRRPKTQAFLWTDYQRISEIIDLSAKNKMRRRGEQITPRALSSGPALNNRALNDHVINKKVLKDPALDVSVAKSAVTDPANAAKHGETADAATDAARGHSAVTTGGATQNSKLTAQQGSVRSTDFSSQFSILLVDTAPSVCEMLRQKLEVAGYGVAIASTVEQAEQLVVKREFDAVVTDFFLQGESGEALCQYLQGAELDRKPLCIVLTAKYSDSIVKRSLGVGAAACLYKNESTELLFARIDALTRTLRRQSRQIPPAQPAVIESGDIEKAGMASLHTTTSTALQEIDQAAGSRKGVVKLVTRATASAVGGDDTGSGVDKPRQIPSTVRAAGENAVKTKVSEVRAKGKTVDKTAKTAKTAKSDSSIATPVVTSAAAQKPPAIEPEQVKTLPELLSQLKNRNPAVQYSVLMLDIDIEAATGDRMGLAESEPMQGLVTKALRKLYKKQNAQVCTEDGKFVLLLTTAKFQDALVLTRKILQVIPKMVPYLNNVTLIAHAGVLRIGRDESVDQDSVIKRCEAACRKARSDGKDNAALVLPNNQYLSAVSAQSPSPSVKSEAQKSAPQKPAARAPSAQPVKKPVASKQPATV